MPGRNSELLSRSALAKMLITCLNQLYQDDSLLFRNNLGERTLVFRIGCYLSTLLNQTDPDSGYSVDCEYNKIGILTKVIYGNHVQYPDLILHKRTDPSVGEEGDNLLVVEFKKGNSRGNQRKGISNDINKLTHLTNSEGNYKYLLGAHVCLYKEYYLIVWYVNGSPKILYKSDPNISLGSNHLFLSQYSPFDLEQMEVFSCDRLDQM